MVWTPRSRGLAGDGGPGHTSRVLDWHSFFLAQPAPLPERLIGAGPDAYFFPDLHLPWRDGEALADYLRCMRDRGTIHAMCEDYQAGAGGDFDLDEADRRVRRIACPLLALWGPPGAARSPVRRAGGLAGLGGRRPGPVGRLRPLSAGGGTRGDVRAAVGILRHLMGAGRRGRSYSGEWSVDSLTGSEE